jgi:Domain of unknown function (DUF4835)
LRPIVTREPNHHILKLLCNSLTLSIVKKISGYKNCKRLIDALLNCKLMNQSQHGIIMIRYFYSLTVTLILILSLSSTSSAQLLYAEITIDDSKIPQTNQNKISNLGQTIEEYINSYEWAPNIYGYDFNLDISIYFDEAIVSTLEDKYKAQLTISNRSNMQYSDKKWVFPLEPGFQLQLSDRYEPFRGMIDYYVNMALGYEFDKVKKFGGTQYFENARRITEQAQFSAQYFSGWDKREDWVTVILEDKNQTMRYLNYLYYTGEWLYFNEHDRDTARQFILYAVKQLEKVKDEKQLNRFFDLNYHNFGTALAEYEEYTSLTKLAAVDSDEAHARHYERLLDKR